MFVLAEPIGKVVHFFDKISVAIVSLSQNLAVGDQVKFLDEKRGIDFDQTVDSLQVEHKDLTSAMAGTEVGIKTSQPTKEGTLVYKV